MQDIKSMTPEELRAYLKELGQPDFRAKQIFQWLHKPVTSFDEMSNLPKKLRSQLAQECFLSGAQAGVRFRRNDQVLVAVGRWKLH